MRVTFFKGLVEKEPGKSVHASWASSPFGTMALLEGPGQLPQQIAQADIVQADEIATLELPGLGREDLDVLITNILTGGYLDKPGVRSAGEAVLYILVNEAIHQLKELSVNSEIID